MAKYLIAPGECLIDKHPAWCQRAQNCRKKRPVQIVCDDNPSEKFVPQRPARTRFQIGLDNPYLFVIREDIEHGNIPVNRRHRVSQAPRQRDMTAATAGKIEYSTAIRHQWKKFLDPVRGRRPLEFA